jgi:hypothetical protein
MPPKFLTDWKIVVDWLAAIGTFLAVIVALFAPRIEQWWHGRPKLTLNVQQVAKLPPDGEGKIITFLPIENNGAYLAEKAEVFIKALRRENEPGSYEDVVAFVPMSLRWAHSEPEQPEIFVTISPKMQRYCILGALKPASNQGNLRIRDDNTVYFELWTEYSRSTDANILLPGHYQIDLILAATGMSPLSKKIWLTVPQSLDPNKMSVKS